MWIQYGWLWCKISHHAQNHPRKLMIFLLLPRPFLLSLSPSPSGTLWTRSRLPRAYLSKMAESALAARAKMRPPCTLKHRVQQEYNSLLVNAWNRIFKSNLSLNNFKWLPPPPGVFTTYLTLSGVGIWFLTLSEKVKLQKNFGAVGFVLINS